jgi:hypothetical protein
LFCKRQNGFVQISPSGISDQNIHLNPLCH